MINALIVTALYNIIEIKVTHPLQNDKNRQKYAFPDF